MDTARVILWGRDIGAVTWLSDRQLGVFQYTPEFAASGIQIAPLTMPLRAEPYQFPDLSSSTFKGLPGLLADSLPDRFGNTLIDAWLARQGRLAGSFTPVERLCYTGSRGMGALEFLPAVPPVPTASEAIELSELVALANQVLSERAAMGGAFRADPHGGRPAGEDREALQSILRVGTSAGGARAKAVLAWNPQTGEFKSGQAKAPKGFGHWLLKFDGVAANGDKELADPQGFGRVEYAYHLMAMAAGIEMRPCRLFEEGGRAHFMTQRFDRSGSSGKLHMQSLGAMMHFDFNQAGAHSYEQALLVMQQLGLPGKDLHQQVRRAFFNVLARNQDDHVKNIAFLMDRTGTWRLSPAFDVSYAYNPAGDWTGRHQMSLGGRRDGFSRDDLVSFAALAGLKTRAALSILDDVIDAVDRWRTFADEAQVFKPMAREISGAFRRDLMVAA
jgi:serine/threonine-protein kinase HipA